MTEIALWFLAIVFIIIFFVILIMVWSRYSELKQKELKKKSLGHDIREQQKSFRTLLQGLVNDQLIAAPHKQGLSMLINNYFVYQPINNVNVSHFNELYNSLVLSVAKLKDTPHDNKIKIAVAFHELALELPINTSDYTARFYLDVAPILADQLLTRIDELIAIEQQSLNQENNSAEDIIEETNAVEAETDFFDTDSSSEVTLESEPTEERKVTLVTREHMSIR